jgi:hypothetical protein
MIPVNIDLYDPNIKEKLAVLPEKMADAAFEILMNQAHLIVALAQVYCPVDTGSLRDSIRVERGGAGLRWREVRVRAGGYVTNPKTGRKVDYAWYVENYTQPFLSPAIAEVRPTITELLKNTLLEKALL